MVADKEHILAEIRRMAEGNGGRALGKDRFAAATGIRESDWSGRFWARWNDAVREAGVEPNRLQERTDDQDAIRQLALETRRLGHLPTHAERTLRRRADKSFPGSAVWRRLGSQRALAGMVAEYGRQHSDFADVVELVLPLEQESVNGDAAPPDIGYVYLLKSGRHYKLGRTNSIGRRGYELAIQLPQRADVVHAIKTDDPAGIEGYWHGRFAERRKNGEWFELTPADVSAFQRRKFM